LTPSPGDLVEASDTSRIFTENTYAKAVPTGRRLSGPLLVPALAVRAVMSCLLYRLRVVVITLRALQDEDLDDLFRWESDPTAARMAAFTRADPADRAAFDAHYERVRSDPDNTTWPSKRTARLSG
jgi:hypothetical protein